MSWFSILILIGLLTGFMVADAILDYVFVIVYAALAFWAAANVVHMFRYRKKYGQIDSDDLGCIMLCTLLAAGALVLQLTVL